MKGLIIIKAFFIIKADKPNKINSIFNLITIKEDIIIVPNKIKEKNINKIAKKIYRLCMKNELNAIVLSKEIKRKNTLVNAIESCNINIFDGRWLAEYMISNIADYIVAKKEWQKEKIEITILANQASDIVLENLKIFAKQYKKINIVTNHINNFKKIEDKLYSEYGILITVTNNKRKSLVKSELIVNFDFVDERLNKYNICDNAVIVSLFDKIKIRKKRFNGIIINDYELKSKKAEDIFNIMRLKAYDLKDLAEEMLYRKDSFYNIRKDISKELYEIKKLYTRNRKFLKFSEKSFILYKSII